MEYLLKASAIIAIFYVCYKLFLQGETFFQSNRLFFIVGLITSILFPLIVIPIYVTIEPQQFVFETTNIILPSSNTETPINWIALFTKLYFAGFVIFCVRLLTQVYSLATLIIRNKKQRSGKYIFVKVNDNISPFSFFNWIVFNPTQFNNNELEQIISHEKAHVNQLHSIDILLIQIATVVFWYNPLIWLYKKELQQNLEFIADANAQKYASCKKNYQHLLLKASMPSYQMALTNNFYNSLIKKRIVMLHKSKSNKLKAWKYLLTLPILALFLMNFSAKEIIIASELDNSKESIINKSKGIGDIIEIIISKDFTNADFKKVKEQFDKLGVTLKFSRIKRNKNNEIIAIKTEFKTPEGHTGNAAQKGNKPITSFSFWYNQDTGEVGIGNRQSMTHKIQKSGKGNSNNNIIVFNTDFDFPTLDGQTKIHKSGKGNPVFVYRSNDSTKIIKSSDSIILKGNLVVRSNNIAADTLWIENNNTQKVKEFINSKNTFVMSGINGEEIDSIPFIISEENSAKIHEIKKVHKDKNTFMIPGTKDEIIDLKGEALKYGKAIIEKDKKGKSVKGWINKDANIFIKNEDGKQPLIILDGKEIPNKEINDLVDPNNIKSINVLKGAAAKKLYGNKGKDGVIEIYSKRNNKLTSSSDGINIEELIKEATTIKSNNIVTSFNDSGETPLFILNNKEVSKKEISNLDPNKIEIVFVLKGDAATKKYGKKGKDGVLFITTKNKE